MARPLPVLKSPRLILRIGEERDVPAILRFYNENRAHLEPWWPRFQPTFFTERHWRQAVRNNANDFQEDRAVRFFLFPLDEPYRVIGLANLNQVVRGVLHGAVLGYGLAADRQGQGLMVEACRRVIDYAFDDMRLHRVSADYVPHNLRSAAVLKRLGFAVEGYARDYLLINGRWEDHVRTGLVNPRWKPDQSS
jgi:ribosomal-protein-alanine N-acetyltransferase